MSGHVQSQILSMNNCRSGWEPFFFALLTLGFIVSCNASDVDPRLDDSCFPDFGVEPIIGLPFSVPAPDQEDIPAWIDKNHLCIRFYDSVGPEKADSILGNFAFVNRAPQNFNDPLQTCNFVRVIDEPADVYYTTYGDTTLPSLGNIKEVQYSHPAIHTESIDIISGGLSNSVALIFESETTEDERRRFIDSVITFNKVVPRQDYLDRITNNQQIRLFFTKKSNIGPIELSTNIRSSQLIRFYSYSVAIFINGLPDLVCPVE